MGRRTLSNAQVRQRLLALEKRMRLIERQVGKKDLRYEQKIGTPLSKSVVDAYNRWHSLGENALEASKLAASALSAVRISTPAQFEVNDPRASARHATQDEYNRHRAALLAAMTTTGRVHIGKWTIRWYSLRRWVVRIWRRFHVA